MLNKVSVIIPVYNKQKYIDDCLKSVVSQTLKELQIIIINDGSKDESGIICKKWREKDNRIVYIEQENQGVSSARNMGLTVADGEYIGFVDADDYVEPEMYELMYKRAKDNNCDIGMCNFIRDNIKQPPEFKDKLYTKEEIINEIYPRIIAYVDESGKPRGIKYSNCLRIFKRDLLLDNNILYNKDISNNEDLLFVLEVMLKCKRFIYLADMYLYHNRIVPNSLSKSLKANSWNKMEKVNDEIFRIIYNHPALHEQIYLRYFITIKASIREITTFNYDMNKKAIKEIKKLLTNEKIKANIRRISKENIKSLSTSNKIYFYFIKNRMSILLFLFDRMKYNNSIK